MTTSPLTLRSVQPKDAEAITRLMADPEVFGNLLQGPYPTEEAWAKRLNAQPSGKSLRLVALQAEEIVGLANLQDTGHIRRSHAVGLAISVSKHAQGQGVGTALMRGLTDYADQWGHILRIELTVFADNARAIRLYERFGFEHEGRFKGYALRNGQYSDVLCMARWHPKPPSLHA